MMNLVILLKHSKEKAHNKELVMIKESNEVLRTLLNVGSVIIIILILLLKYEIIVMLLENIQALHIEIVISILN